MSASQEKHGKGIRVKAFCAERKKTCGEGQSYRDNCTPSPPFTDFQAHHLLCVASVTEFLAIDPKITEIIKNTTWCINRPKNMYAMPIWGHTIKHYCKFGGMSHDQTPAPLFEDIPQHNYDHNSGKGYKVNHVDKALQKIADKIEKMAEKEHKKSDEQLAAVLDNLSESFRGMLQTLGKRSGGTHKAWGAARSGSDDKWYLPFSMALSGNAEKRTYPGSSDSKKMAEMVKKLVSTYGKWGA